MPPSRGAREMRLACMVTLTCANLMAGAAVWPWRRLAYQLAITMSRQCGLAGWRMARNSVAQPAKEKRRRRIGSGGGKMRRNGGGSSAAGVRGYLQRQCSGGVSAASRRRGVCGISIGENTWRNGRRPAKNMANWRLWHSAKAQLKAAISVASVMAKMKQIQAKTCACRDGMAACMAASSMAAHKISTAALACLSATWRISIVAA